jgi:hypothetical protein
MKVNWRRIGELYVPFGLMCGALLAHWYLGVDSLSIIFPLVVMAVWYGGFYSGMATASLIIIYAIFSVDDSIRVTLMFISLMFTVIPVAILQRRAELVGSAENVINKLREAHALSLTLMVNWPDLEDSEKWSLTESGHNMISHVLTLARGWHILAKEHNNIVKGDINE